MPAARAQFQLNSGVSRYSRGRKYARRSIWKLPKEKRVNKIEKKTIEKPSAAKSKKFRGKDVKVLPGNEKGPRFYPAFDAKVPVWRASKHTQNSTKLRSNITPGTVVILLTGKHRGARTVFLKQLESGNLLVSGPFKINGVPLKRVNQRFVIATSTKVDISSVKLSDKVNDSFFGKKADAKVEQSRVSEQKNVDEQLITAIKKVPQMADYLQNRFSLRRDTPPHTLKF